MIPTMKPKLRQSQNIAGLTVLELLVTAAVSSLILAFLVQMFSSSQGIWISVDEQSDRMTSVRSALSIFSDDARDLFHRGSRGSRRVPLYLDKATGAASSKISLLVQKRAIDQDPANLETSPPAPGICIVAYEVASAAGGGIREGDLIRTFAGVVPTSEEMMRRNPNFPPVAAASADEHWDAAFSGGTVEREVVASNVVFFSVTPKRFRRNDPSGPIPTDSSDTRIWMLEDIFNSVGASRWPQPDSAPEVDPLPSGWVYDPDFSAPDLLEVRLVVCTSAVFSNLSSTEKSDLRARVFDDLADEKLDGKSSGSEVLNPGELRSLTLMSTAIAYDHHR